MATLPALVNDTIFSDLFDDPFFSGLRHAASQVGDAGSPASLLSTDVRETDNAYDVDIDLPGYNKDDIAVELHDGYLTVSAHKDEKHDENDEGGKWIRRERYVGDSSRSFYVGDEVKDSNIHASYKDGTLSLKIDKVTPKPEVENRQKIAIEG